MDFNNCFWDVIAYCFENDFPWITEQVQTMNALKNWMVKKNKLSEMEMKENLEAIIEIQQNICNTTGIALWDCCAKWINEKSADSTLKNIANNELTDIFSMEQIEKMSIIQNWKAKVKWKDEIYQFKIDWKLQEAPYKAYSTSNGGFWKIAVDEKKKDWKTVFEQAKQKEKS